MQDRMIPHFICKVLQNGNEICIPIPFGNLENLAVALLANNPGTCVLIEKYESIKI